MSGARAQSLLWRQLYAVTACLQAALPQYGAIGREFQRFSIGKNGVAFARIGEMTKSLLIVAHAPSDNTRALLDAVRTGAEEASAGSVRVSVLSPFDAGPDAVRASDAIILGTTENLGYMSGALKDFFDRTYYPCLEETQGLPYALFVRAGHDGTGTCRAIESITTGLRWRAVQEPLVCRGSFAPEFIEKCRDLGAGMAAGLEAGIF
tara:strand:+ start:96 stop:716 length:621 start_codon:yes stop_codon:yes gene_type:complete